MGIHFWCQNLHDEETKRGLWRSGRCRWWLRRADDSAIGSVGAEWCIPTTHCHARLVVGGGDDDDMGISFACRLFALWLSLDGIFPRSWYYDREKKKAKWLSYGREIDLSWHDGTLWWALWQKPMEWSSKTPKWLHGNWTPLDTLLGKHDYSKRELSTERVDVEMPEGIYPATVVLFESTWKRPRWPKARRLVRAEITPDKPIGEPGKGENSYDCEDDATYSLTTVASSAAEAAQKLHDSVMRTRTQRAGADWVPSS